MFDLDKQARGLYTEVQFFCECGTPITRYQNLLGKCPICQRVLWVSPGVKPEQGHQTVADLEAHRRLLGLEVLGRK